jgi:hypothetical protein
METLEVLRRWIWIFFRFEAEWTRLASVDPQMRHIRGNSIPAIELSTINTKL